MNQLVAALLTCSFIAWCFALAFRREKWAFAAWFPFTVANVCGTLAWLSIIPQLGNSGSGAAGGFAGLGATTAFLFLLICPAILFVTIRFRPQRFPVGVVVLTVLLVVVGVPFLWGRASQADVVPVHLKFQTTDGSAIPNVVITYETRNRLEGFAAERFGGSARSDAKGDATVYTRSTHEVNLQFRCKGFASTSLWIDRTFPTLAGNQCRLDWTIPRPTIRGTIRRSQSRTEMWDLAITKELNVLIYLPRINEADLPYPEYHPSWTKK